MHNRIQTQGANKWGFKLFILIPIINFIASILANYYVSFLGLHTGHWRGGLLTIFALIFIFKSYINNKAVNSIYIILIYVFILSFFSVDILKSLIIFNKFFLAYMMFPMGYYYINTIKDYKKLMMVSFILLASIGIYTFISNLLELGMVSYYEEAIYFGEQGVNITKLIPVIIVLLPVALILDYPRHWKIIFILISVTGILLVLLGMKRGALLATIGGIISFFIFSKYKLRILRYLPIFLLLLIPLLIQFSANIFNVYEARNESGRLSFRSQVEYGERTDEARLLELYWVLEKFSDGDYNYKLFGEDLFLGRKNALGFLDSERMNHVDYTSMLDSTGIIGLLLFLLTYYYIYKLGKKYFKASHKGIFENELISVFYSLFIVHLLLSISGTITTIDLRGLLLMHMGAICGLLRQSALENKLIIQQQISLQNNSD